MLCCERMGPVVSSECPPSPHIYTQFCQDVEYPLPSPLRQSSNSGPAIPAQQLQPSNSAPEITVHQLQPRDSAPATPVSYSGPPGVCLRSRCSSLRRRYSERGIKPKSVLVPLLSKSSQLICSSRGSPAFQMLGYEAGGTRSVVSIQKWFSSHFSATPVH